MLVDTSVTIGCIQGQEMDFNALSVKVDQVEQGSVVVMIASGKLFPDDRLYSCIGVLPMICASLVVGLAWRCRVQWIAAPQCIISGVALQSMPPISAPQHRLNLNLYPLIS